MASNEQRNSSRDRLFQEFQLPDNYDYTNITSVSIAGCVAVNFLRNSLLYARNIEEIIVEDVENWLDFDVLFVSDRIKLLRLANIGRILRIASDTFVNVQAIETFEIENALVEDFAEDFGFGVSHFVLTNVTIKNISKFNFSERGTTLRIANSVFHNITSSPNSANFQNVEIVDSNLELHTPGLVSVEGDVIVVRNSSFLNVSMSLVARDAITISGICADGKSTIRVKSMFINSTDNRVPNEIIYPNDNQEGPEKVLINRNNMVCKASNCDCRPKSNGQAQPRVQIASMLIVGLAASLGRFLDL